MSTESTKVSQNDTAEKLQEWLQRGHQIQTAIDQAAHRRIAVKKRERKRAREQLPGIRRCCACRIALLRIEQFRELHWLPRRGKYRPALCYKCVNRLVDLELAPAAKPKRPHRMGMRRHTGGTGQGADHPGS